jgi:proteasome lid subunit RPN8/RPN11
MRLVEVTHEVADQVRKFLDRDSSLERAGFLLGRYDGAVTFIRYFVPCPDAPSSSASVTFRPAEWQLAHVHPAVSTGVAEIVGWAHSHPKMPVGMSSRDVFIHKHFFSGDGQVAWIRDPVAGVESLWTLCDGRPDPVSVTLTRGHS